MQVALARAVAKGRREPEVVRRAGRVGASASQRALQQRIDARRLIVVVPERLSPPNVSARLEDHGRGVGGIAPGKLGEVGGRGREPARVQRVEPGAEVRPLDAGMLQQDERGDE